MRNMIALSRSAAAGLVRHEEDRSGSRMEAYETVAAAVGTSSEWLRKFISRKEGKEPRISVGFKLLTSYYEQVCERVEQAGNAEHELAGEIDAAIEGINLLVEATSRAGRSAETPATLDQP